MSDNRFILRFALLLASILGGQAAGRAAPQTDATLQEVIKAWRAHQTGAQTFRFSWNQRGTYPKGSILTANAQRQKNPEGLTVPPDTIHFDAHFALTVDQTKMRYFRDTLGVSVTKELMPKPCTSISDGKTVTTFYPTSTVNYPQGYIRNDKINTDDAQDIDLTPLLITYRALDRIMSPIGADPSLSNCTVASSRSVVRGCPCVFVRQSLDTSQGSRRLLWLDPQRGYICLRYALSVGGRDHRSD